MDTMLGSFHLLDALDIVLVAVLVYRIVMLLRGALAIRVLIVLVALFLLSFAAQFAGLVALSRLLAMLIGSALVVVAIIFHSDIRRTLLTYGREREVPAHREAEIADVIEAVEVAAGALSSRNIGALIVLERSMGLDPFIEIGTEIDAKVTSELLTSIFLPYSPIHDGAVIIRRGKLTMAGCFLPLTRNPNISKNLGTRHRAAIGLTEQVDAVVVVVSEETGSISLVNGGKITRDLDLPTLRKALRRHLGSTVAMERDANV